jgi:heptosyltransferase-1
MRQVAAVVAVDTGLGHLAAALGVPCVSLYGPTRIALVGAYGRHQVHLRSPLSAERTRSARDKMAAIAPDTAWEAVAGLVRGGR